MSIKPKKLILLDGNALIHRAYHALPPLTTKTGEPVGAVYGFAMTLLSVLEKFKPDYIAASFDLAGPTFRHEAYEEYKATRVKAPDDLYEQIPRVKDVVKAFNIPIYEKEGFEADDILGTLARQASGDISPTPHPAKAVSSTRAGEREEEIIETVIVTGDNDTLQLVSPRTKVFSIRKGLKDLVLYDRDAVVGKYGFPPEALPDYKGLAGDPSDNIPGVAGIGAKTATDLIREYGSLENIYEHLGDIKESVRKKLEADRRNAFSSKDLGTIRTDVPVAFDPAKCVADEYDHQAVAALFRELGFFSLLKRVGNHEAGSKEQESGNVQKSKIPARLAGGKNRASKEKTVRTGSEAEKILKRSSGSRVAVWLSGGETSLFGGGGVVGVELSYRHSGPVSASREPSGKEAQQQVQDDQGESVMIEWNEETKPVLATFFEDEGREKIFYDAKTAIHALGREGVTLRGIVSDAMIAAYLLQAGTRVEFEHLVIAELGEGGLGSNAASLLALSSRLSAKLEAIVAEQEGEWNIRRLLREVEMPLIPILASMEENGIRLDVVKFKALSEDLGRELADIERKIHDLAGREFNVNSPKQLAEVLFDELNIPTAGVKKTKTGISTASSELAKLREYPIVGLVEGERELFKLKTTYLDAFPALVDDRSRIHTTYQQAVAATGRLSSTDPNLQNIPASEKWSVAIRGAFEAEPGNVLVGADYSQIELRVMAHLSGDRNLVSAFLRGLDVHKATAAAVYGVSVDAVTPDQRRSAKVFNFGLMFGMSAYGLAQNLGIDQKQASDFIAMYFEKFPGVAAYMESMKAFAKENGYIETELGRRRYVPEIRSSNPQLMKAGERMAINMPIQGLEADIMKLAMIRAAGLVSRYEGKAKMLLQVHDELIFEVEDGIAEAFAKEAKREMESAYALRVPLVVDVATGRNWGEI